AIHGMQLGHRHGHVAARQDIGGGRHHGLLAEGKHGEPRPEGRDHPAPPGRAWAIANGPTRPRWMGKWMSSMEMRLWTSTSDAIWTSTWKAVWTSIGRLFGHPSAWDARRLDGCPIRSQVAVASFGHPARTPIQPGW